MVPITPMRPLTVAAQAACAAGTTTPEKGTPASAESSGVRAELTVPQAAMTSLTSCRLRKRMSCIAYFRIVSRLRFP